MNATGIPAIRPRKGSWTLTAALAIALVGPMLGGCATRGSGDAKTETRELDSFAAIDIGGAFELTVHVDPSVEQRVEIRGDDNIVPLVTTKVSGNELDIGLDANGIRPKLPLEIEIWVPALGELDAGGATQIVVEGLHGESFELELSGANESKLSGNVAHFEVDISGAADLQARALQAKTVELELSGAGSAEVFASERLDVEVSGAGSVRYFGKPGTVEKDISGAGSVEAGE